MKKIVAVVVAFFIAVSFDTFGGWSNEGVISLVSQIQGSAEASSCLVLDTPCILAGYKENDGYGNAVWVPADIEFNDAGLPVAKGGVVKENTYNNFMEVVKFGNFDDAKSITHFIEKFQKYETDDMGETYAVYSTGKMKDFFATMYNKNDEAFQSALLSVNNKFTQYTEELQAKKGSVGEDVTEQEAEDAKNMDDTLSELEENIEDQKKKVEEGVSNARENIASAQIELAKYSEERAQQSAKILDEAMTTLDTALSRLNIAIAENDYDALSDVNASLDAATQMMDDALAAINGLAGDGYEQTRVEIGEAKTVIVGARINIARSKSERDMSHARTGKASLEGLNRLYNPRKAIRTAEKNRKQKKGEVEKYDAIITWGIGIDWRLIKLISEVSSMRKKLNYVVRRYMVDMNSIGAYLGSTNSMAFFSVVTNESIIKYLPAKDFRRWYKFSPPEPLFRDEKDKNTYETIGKIKYEKYNFDNILRLIGSTLFVTYLDTEFYDRFTKMYDDGTFKELNIRGFYQEVSSQSGNTVTNWMARNIDAPVNWADNGTIKVVNGKFSVNINSMYYFDPVSNKITNCKCQFGSSVISCADYSVDSPGEYYAHVTPSGNSATLSISTSSEAQNMEFVFLVNRITSSTNGLESTYSIGVMPFVMVYR